MKQIKQLIVITMLMLCMVTATAQIKPHPKPQVKPAALSKRLSAFKLLAAQANVSFVFPNGFKEINAPDNEYFSFDYGMEIPGKEFEIWLQVKSLKENWAGYERYKNNKNSQSANPDSLFDGIARANALAFTGEKNYFIRTIPTIVLTRYNADAGKSYLLTLLDLPATKHYKYALLIMLQKSHTGTILAVCFANEKGPEFFKNIDKASNCIKFKP